MAQQLDLWPENPKPVIVTVPIRAEYGTKRFELPAGITEDEAILEAMNALGYEATRYDWSEAKIE